jgi:Protein of unknown function (DUF4242)
VKSQQSSDADVPDSTFLVERYLPTAAISGLAASVARVAIACDQSRDGHAQVRYLQSTYLPAEDTCFCLFQADSSDAVRAVNAAGQFALDRITAAVVMFSRIDSRSTDTNVQGDPL